MPIRWTVDGSRLIEAARSGAVGDPADFVPDEALYVDDGAARLVVTAMPDDLIPAGSLGIVERLIGALDRRLGRLSPSKTQATPKLAVICCSIVICRQSCAAK